MQRYAGRLKIGNFSKIFPKKFAGKEKVRIFAARLKQNGSSLKILKDFKYKKQVPNLKDRERQFYN